MLTENGSSVFIGSPVILIPRSVSHHRPGVRDDQPFQYDTNDWFSIENESLLLCSLAVISLRIPWATRVQSSLSSRRRARHLAPCRRYQGWYTPCSLPRPSLRHPRPG